MGQLAGRREPWSLQRSDYFLQSRNSRCKVGTRMSPNHRNRQLQARESYWMEETKVKTGKEAKGQETE